MNTVHTLDCDLKWLWIEKYRKGELPAKWWLADKDGNLIPVSQLADAQDGCEVNRRLGFADHCACPDYNQSFQIIDENTDEPIPDAYYEMKDSSGNIISGRTDANGYTQKLHAVKAMDLEINVYMD